MFPVKISSHLKKLSKQNAAIRRQFGFSAEENSCVLGNDPLQEEKFVPVKGLIHKYHNRVLVTLTANCSAYCRFCTRRRRTTNVKENIITEKDLGAMVKYIKLHKEIKEVIISGGDPLTAPLLLGKVLKKFSSIPQIKILRVGTRLPISDPSKVNSEVISALQVVKNKPLYILLHCNHPAELTKQTVGAIKKLQKVCTMILSQTVFLKGVNDSVGALEKLFTWLVEIGVKPYYLLRCEPVKGASHFIVPFEKEVQIATELRKRLTGLACPEYVIDVPGGVGKVPVPLGFWEFGKKIFKDFDGKKALT